MTVDGKRVPVARMNFNLVGVPLPTGARVVRLEFDDPAYAKGKMLTLITLGVAVAAWILGWIVDVRRRTPDTVAA